MSYSAKKNLLEELLEDFKEEGNNFLDWVYDQLFLLDDYEIPADELIEGSGEKQLDVIHIEDDVENKKAAIHILQAKEANGFSANTVVLMTNGITKILDLKKAEVQKLSNLTLASKIIEIRDIFKKYSFGSVELHVYYATLGNSADVGREMKDAIHGLESKFKGYGFADFKFHLCGATELYDLWWRRTNSDRSISESISFSYDVNTPSLIEIQAQDYKAVICTISGSEIARLASVEPRDAIFDMNVRGHLGPKGRVNSSILEACTDSAQARTFWLKNNGITMVCKKLNVVKDPDDAVIKVENVQIVNGCQTSVTLREAFSSSKLQPSVSVLAKIYEITDTQLINKIVLATNNQNSIVSRDLVANDECQNLIQQTVEAKLGLFYERKRGEAKSKQKPRSQIVDSEKAGQSYLAIKKKLPTVSRTQKYRIYEPALYSDLFQKSMPLQLALSYHLYEYCKKRGMKEAKQLKKGDKEHSLLTYGVFHLARAFAYFVFDSEELPKGESEIVKIVTSLRKDNKSFDVPFKKAKKLCLRILQKTKAASANNYFKSGLSQEQLTEAIDALA